MRRGARFALWAGMEAIYQRPGDYDLEHEDDDEDVKFHKRLVESLRPRRMLELACGSGRVTVPLAQLAARLDFEVVGVDHSATMLEEAEAKRDTLDTGCRDRVHFVSGDIRSWTGTAAFDLIIAPCSSLSHLLTLDDQITAWRTAGRNLVPGGRFVADLTMPDLGAYAESLQSPPRTLLEIDLDTCDPTTGARLLRYKTTRYEAGSKTAE